MPVKNLFAILLLLVLVNPLSAQDTSAFYHIIFLQTGVNQVKDENLHPKVSTGTMLELSYGFESSRKKNRISEFHFDLGYSRLRTSFEDLSKSLNLKLKFSYSQSLQVWKQNNFRYLLGPEINLAYNIFYFPNWDDSHLYWADYLSLGPKNVFILRVHDKNAWISSLSFPLFSVFSRPEPYRLFKIDDTSAEGIAKELNGNCTATLSRVFFTRIQTEYRFPILKNKLEAVSYTFEYVRVKSKTGRAFQQLNHEIGLKIFL